MKLLTRPRTRLTLSIGGGSGGDNTDNDDDHRVLLQVILLVHRKHLDWFNNFHPDTLSGIVDVDDDNQDNISINSAGRWAEFYQVLQEQVVPRCLDNFVEDSYYNHHEEQEQKRKRNHPVDDNDKSNNTNKKHKTTAHLKRPPALLGTGGIPLQGGGASAASTKNNNNNSRNNKGKKGKTKKLTKKEQKNLEQELRCQNIQTEKQAKRLAQREHHQRAFGTTLQLCYKTELLQGHSIGSNIKSGHPKYTTRGEATLVFPSASSSKSDRSDDSDGSDHDGPNNNDKRQGSGTHQRLRALTTLPQRLVVACGPWKGSNSSKNKDGEHETNSNQNDDEVSLLLKQREQIPIAALFRQSRTSS